MVDIDTVNGEATVETIRREGGDAIFVRADVSKSSDVDALFTPTSRIKGVLDILYNNAAVRLHGRDSRAHELREEIWDRTHSTNLRGVWLCSKYAIPILLKRGSGSIIHVPRPQD
jgi:NAD(P)-dependent dehydrogenase (short-subunit alcohol dehydrogenase family)